DHRAAVRAHVRGPRHRVRHRGHGAGRRAQPDRGAAPGGGAGPARVARYFPPNFFSQPSTSSSLSGFSPDGEDEGRPTIRRSIAFHSCARRTLAPAVLTYEYRALSDVTTTSSPGRSDV